MDASRDVREKVWRDPQPLKLVTGGARGDDEQERAVNIRLPDGTGSKGVWI